eukprot:TRINITY_DN3821_c0_g1_i1.p1 TRINITY_DN3821_c0_g1~~TRINITY_DN3821_c0_g1_i1.p1  ORF type:complete len:1358 (+),score=511.06 TRINITY_DN3821_c0_g1_i1:63-4136(+)
MDLISDELRKNFALSSNKYNEEDDKNEYMISIKKKKIKKPSSIKQKEQKPKDRVRKQSRIEKEVEEKKLPRMTRKKRRRVEVLQNNEKKKKEREALFEKLKEHQLKEGQYKLMSSVKEIGQKKTKKELLELEKIRPKELQTPQTVQNNNNDPNPGTQQPQNTENKLSFVTSDTKVDLSTGNSDKKPIVKITKKKKRKRKNYDVTFQNNPLSNPKSKLLIYKDDEESSYEEVKPERKFVNKKEKDTITRKEFTKIQVENLKLKKKKNVDESSDDNGGEGDAGDDSDIEVVVNDDSGDDSDEEKKPQKKEQKVVNKNKGSNNHKELLENWQGDDSDDEKMKDEEDDSDESDESEDKSGEELFANRKNSKKVASETKKEDNENEDDNEENKEENVDENNVDDSNQDSEKDDEEDDISDSEDSESKTFSEDSIYLMDVPILPTSENPVELTYKKTYVEVKRPKDVVDSRKMLPIISEESRILETIEENDIIIICGETGSGKTTQVPQFLYETGYTKKIVNKQSGSTSLIGITQPRRVAAISMAERVSYELGIDEEDKKENKKYEDYSIKRVAYQIRYDANVGQKTEIKFMTDGVLLKEIQTDFLLRKYSVIVIDEAHERTINTDILIGLLSRIVPFRSKLSKENPENILPLKLIIMSATLRVSDFTSNQKLFPTPPPVIKVESRQFPVTIHFNKVTNEDYVEEAYKKVKKIHNNLPPGGILIFLTGKQEIIALCKQLQEEFPLNKDSEKSLKQGMHVLSLYSSLTQDLQMKVFENPPPGNRLIVVATNIAETSLTIPNISYVVDCGKSKQKVWMADKNLSTFEVKWISKASADQRSGRAGRVGPGHCYRLYSSAVFQNDLEDHARPEILITPIEDIVLQMKCMSIDKIQNFPFPTPPSLDAIERALKTLTYLGALLKTEVLGVKGNTVIKHKVTQLGHELSTFPVAPRYGKMLLLAKKENILGYIVAIVAGLSVQHSPFIEKFEEEVEIKKEYENENNEKVSFTKKAQEEEDRRKEKARIQKRRKYLLEMKKKWGGDESDLFALLSAVGAFYFVSNSTKKKNKKLEKQKTFCSEHNLNFKLMNEIYMLSGQLCNILMKHDEELQNKLNNKSENILNEQLSKKPTKKQKITMRQIITSGHVDSISRLEENTSSIGMSVYLTCLTSERVYIHPSSFLSTEKCDYVVYKEIINSTRPYMKQLTSINPSWLYQLAPALSNTSTPLAFPLPRYDEKDDDVKCWVNVTYGPNLWNLPKQEVSYPQSHERCKFFAKFLIEGFVLPFLKNFQQNLSEKPTLIVSEFNERDPTVYGLVRPLLENKISSLKGLKEKWSTPNNKIFLLAPILAWFQPSVKNEITKLFINFNK